MMRHALSIFIISLFLGSLVYECIWFIDVFKPKYNISCSCLDYKNCFGPCWINKLPQKLWTIISMILIGLWTLFWSILLIMTLQISENLDKSAVFLLQQSIFSGFIGWCFAINIFNKFLDLSIPLLYSIIPFMSQISLFCIFLGFRYYLTYRENGSMEVPFGFKCFTFFLVNGLSIGLGQSQTFFISSIVILVLCLLFLVIITFKRRGRIQQNKLTGWTMWSFFVFSALPYCIWIIFIEKNLFYFESERSWIFGTDEISIFNAIPIMIMLILLPQQLNAFITIFIDSNLRKTFFKFFYLTMKCDLFKDQEVMAPLLGDGVYNAPYQALIDNHLRTGAHGYRNDDDIRTGAHDFRNDDFRTEAHGYRNDDDIRTGAHGFRNDDIRTGAHGFRNDDIRTGAHGYRNDDDTRTGAHGYRNDDDIRTGAQGYRKEDTSNIDVLKATLAIKKDESKKSHDPAMKKRRTLTL